MLTSSNETLRGTTDDRRQVDLEDQSPNPPTPPLFKQADPIKPEFTR